jgi:phytol kinase
MENQFLLCFLFFVGLWVLLFTIEFFYRKFALIPENSSKICHLTTVASTLLLPYLLKDHWYMLFFSIALTVLLIVTRKATYLKSLHGIERKTIGSQLLPVTFYIIFLISLKMNNKYIFVLPITILAVSDPIDGLAGFYCRSR